MMKAILPFSYSAGEMKRLLESLIILVDTREQKSGHILRHLDQKGVEYREKSLSYGDYSFMLPADPELGLLRDVHFTDQLIIERKANLEELSHCFAQERQRFENELIRATGCRAVLLVEDATYEDIVAHNYRTQYRPQSFAATLFSFMHRYGLQVAFIPSRLSGHWIHWCCKYWLREWLK